MVNCPIPRSQAIVFLPFYNGFPSIEKFWSCCCLSFHSFPLNSQWHALFHCMAYDYSHTDWEGLCDHLRDVPWEDILKFITSGAAGKFYEWVQFGIDAYISNCKYQVKPHSSLWFSAVCAAAVVHRNHFFVCTNRINLLNLK